MARRYPRIGAKHTSPHNFYRKTCEFCEKLGLLRIDVQVTEMRGDDEVFILCNEHKSLSADELIANRFPTKEAARD